MSRPGSAFQNACRLRLFARFSLGDDHGQELVVGAARLQALVAYLAMQPSMTCGREQVMALLWDDTSESNARHSLSQAILALRKRLEPRYPGMLQADRTTIRFDPGRMDVDVRQFERQVTSDDPVAIGQALDMFEGGFLPGFVSGAPAFDEWAEYERLRLWISFRRSVEHFAVHPAAPAEQAVEAVRRLSAREPFDEDVHRLALRTLAQRYGSPAALAEHEQFRKTLDRELGTAPDAETTKLVADIRAIRRMGTPSPLHPPLQAPMKRAFPTLFGNVPQRDFNFTGRTAALDWLHGRLAVGPAGDASIAARRVAVHGLGGIGKTTVVAEYAYRHASAYGGVWWAGAAQRTLLIESLATLAVALDPRLAVETDQAKAAMAGLALLSHSPRPLLLVYDGVESPNVIADLVPTSNAAVIITSRWPDWAGRALEMKLDGFDDAAAAEFLQKRTGRLDAPGALRLSKALGLLPLALDHAGAYCRLSGLNFDGYMRRIDAVVAHAPRGVAYPASIAATVDIALETAGEYSPAARTLLGSMAFLAPEHIPLGLIGRDIIDEVAKDAAVAALFAVSLVEHEVGEDGEALVTLHPLVQSAMRHRLALERNSGTVARQSAAMLAAAFPATALTDPLTWQACARLLPHALAFRDLSQGLFPSDENGAALLASLGGYLHIRGAYGEAEQVLREAISITEGLSETGHPHLPGRQNMLGLLLSTTGRYSEAEPLFRQVIATLERSVGRESLDVAVPLNNLGRLLSDTKRYEEAEPLFREAIAIVDRTPAADASYALAWRNNLAIVLNETGRNDLAQQVYREALAIGEAGVGRRHHEMARCMNNLGLLLRDLGQLAESERMILQGLEIAKDVLGEQHPIYARHQENLAKTLLLMRRPAEALELAQIALYNHEAKLGMAHFWTLASATTVGRVMLALGDAPGSAEICRRFGLTELPDHY